MSLLVAFLAVSGALLWVAIAGAVIFGVFFSAASAEDRATVDLPDVDMDERLSLFVDNVRVIYPDDQWPPISRAWAEAIHTAPAAECDACTGRDRGAF